MQSEIINKKSRIESFRIGKMYIDFKIKAGLKVPYQYIDAFIIYYSFYLHPNSTVYAICVTKRPNIFCYAILWNLFVPRLVADVMFWLFNFGHSPMKNVLLEIVTFSFPVVLFFFFFLPLHGKPNTNTDKYLWDQAALGFLPGLPMNISSMAKL